VRHLVIDLGGTNSVGSEVIGVLVGLANRVKQAGGKAAICRVSMHLHDMLTSVGLLKTWPHCPTRESAVILVNRL
jgi:anti-anti-sigma factor